MSFDGIFAAAGVDGYVHALDLSTGAEAGHRADELVVAASTFKLPVLIELFRQADAGELVLTEQTLVPVAGRAPGSTGLSVLLDPVTLSWRDLATTMMVVSDNAATDVICARVGLDRVDALLGELGLTDTVVPLDCDGLMATIVEDLGVRDLGEFRGPITDELARRLRVVDPARTGRTTARESARLVELLLQDAVAAPESCAAMRRILALQVWPHRLASGFPEDEWRTGGKTGTVFSWRNEVGFAQRGDDRFAIAVFTRAHDINRQKHPEADAAIGLAARHAVETLLARR